jgi:hypothetical protein
MDKKKVVKIIKEKLGETLFPIGFKFKLRGGELITFYRENQETTDIINLRILDYGKEFILQSPTADIRFLKVEEIFDRLRNSKILTPENIKLMGTFFLSDRKTLQERNLIPSDLTISDDKTAERTMDIYTDCLLKDVLPFFRDYGDLKTIEQFIISTPHIELNKNIQEDMPAKKLIILKITNSPMFEEYYHWYKNIRNNSTDQELIEDFDKLEKVLMG